MPSLVSEAGSSPKTACSGGQYNRFKVIVAWWMIFAVSTVPLGPHNLPP